MRRLAIVVLALAIGAPDAHAQTPAQWSQLVAYVGKLANRMLAQQVELERLAAENEQQRVTLNATIAALDNERCRVSRLTSALKDFAVAPPTVPVVPGWTTGPVACSDLKSPVPAFPSPLAAPAAP